MPHLADLLEQIADDQPDAPALIHGDDVRSWAQFDDRAARFAAALAAAGVGLHETVAIDLYNASEWLECFVGCAKARARAANVNYRYTHQELADLLGRAQARALVFHASLADRVLPAAKALPDLALVVQVDDVGGAAVPEGARDYEQLLAAHAPAPRTTRGDEDPFLGFTGGTTGLPKGVLTTYTRTAARSFDFRLPVLGEEFPTDCTPVESVRRLREAGRLPVAVPASPLMHSTGLIYTALPTLAAGGAVCTLTARSFDAAELLDAAERRRVNAVAIVGDAFAKPIVRELERRREAGRATDLSALRTICSAGVAWSAEVKQALLAFVPQVSLSDACGSTEGASYGNVVIRRGDESRTAAFRALPGVLVLDEHDRPLPPGAEGLLASPSPNDGYFNDPEASARTFRVVDGVAYVIPGDYGRIDADGTLTLIGRKTSTINTGGEKVHPEEIEQAIRALPGVDDALVFGTPHERWGQQVTALVQPEPGTALDADAVVAALRGHLAGYKLPRRMLFGAVPRLPNGKPDYAGARALVR